MTLPLGACHLESAIFLPRNEKERLLVCILCHTKHVVGCWVFKFIYLFVFHWLKNPPPILAFRENFWLSPIQTISLTWKVQPHGVSHIKEVWTDVDVLLFPPNRISTGCNSGSVHLSFWHVHALLIGDKELFQSCFHLPPVPTPVLCHVAET